MDPSIEAFLTDEEKQLQYALLHEHDLKQALKNSAAHRQQQHVEPADHELQYPPLDNAPAQRTVLLPNTAIGAIIGRKGRNIPTLCRELGVSIEVPTKGNSADSHGTTPVIIKGDTGLAVLMAKLSLLEHTASPEAVGLFLDLMRIKHWQKLHVFVDYSNILISARRSTGWPSLQIKAQALLKRVVRERDVQCVHVAGSTSSAAEAEALKTEWGAQAFGGLDGAPVRCTPDFCVRPAATAESCLNIDDRIVARAVTSVAKGYQEPQRLVLLTGDGNDNGAGWASFAETCELALKKGWRVEVWSWKSSVAGVYRRLQADYPHHFHLFFLDLYLDEIVTVGPSSAPTHTSPAGQPAATPGRGAGGAAPGRGAGGAAPGRGAGGAAPGRGAGGRGKCHFFGKAAGCKKGSACPFWHEVTTPPAPAPAPAPPAPAPLALECPVCYKSEAEITGVWQQFECGHRICKDCGGKILGQPQKPAKCHICIRPVQHLTPRYD